MSINENSKSLLKKRISSDGAPFALVVTSRSLRLNIVEQLIHVIGAVLEFALRIARARTITVGAFRFLPLWHAIYINTDLIPPPPYYRWSYATVFEIKNIISTFYNYKRL